MSETPVPRSPDSLQLRGTPATSARLSRKAVLAVVALLAVILGFIVISVSKDNSRTATAAEDTRKELVPAVSAGKSITKDIPDVIPELPPLPPPRETVPELRPIQSPPPVKSAQEDPRLADTEVPKFVAAETAAMQQRVAGWSAASPSQDPDTAVDSAAGTNGSDPGAGNALRRVSTLAEGAGANERDLNQQDEKLAFQRQDRQSEYLNSRLTPPRSAFELKTGTVIPGMLVGAMNSDLPGEIVAQVSQNVYDSISGAHLLIPQGTRLYGRYDSNISFGQGRLLVSWQRLIFPNGYTLELRGMSGHDQGGDAGFADQVNNHLWRVFGAALLTSAFSAGLQLSQPQQATTTAVPTSGQVAAAAVGQQMAQVGTQIAERNLRVQPTIVIRKGYRFNVMVNKDVVFPGSYEP